MTIVWISEHRLFILFFFKVQMHFNPLTLIFFFFFFTNVFLMFVRTNFCK